MPTELEELVDFISHGNTQVRQLAVENLVPYSISQPSIFKANDLLPIKDLKLLVRDYEQIAKDALTILINLSPDRDILDSLASDEEFMKTLLTRITNPTEPNANLLAMLLANLAKSDTITNLLTLTIALPSPAPLPSPLAISALLDLFVRGAHGTYNPSANFDYLSYLFADLAKHPSGRAHLLHRQAYDDVVPLTKLTVFTEHASAIRRKGVASTIKNVAFETDAHAAFLAEHEINILPYILLPLCGGDAFPEDEMLDLLPDLQFLPASQKRDADPRILQTHIETLMLLTTTREGRDRLREVGVYPVVREAHLGVEDEEVREACERLVQVLMRDEEGEEEADKGMTALRRVPKGEVERPQAMAGGGSWAKQEGGSDDDDDDDRIVEV